MYGIKLLGFVLCLLWFCTDLVAEQALGTGLWTQHYSVWKESKSNHPLPSYNSWRPITCSTWGCDQGPDTSEIVCVTSFPVRRWPDSDKFALGHAGLSLIYWRFFLSFYVPAAHLGLAPTQSLHEGKLFNVLFIELGSLLWHWFKITSKSNKMQRGSLHTVMYHSSLNGARLYLSSEYCLRKLVITHYYIHIM